MHYKQGKSLNDYVYIISFFLHGFVMWSPYGAHLGNPIYGDSPYGTHGEPGCTPHMGGPYMYVCWALVILSVSCLVLKTSFCVLRILCVPLW